MPRLRTECRPPDPDGLGILPPRAVQVGKRFAQRLLPRRAAKVSGIGQLTGSAADVRKQAAIFEAAVGSGRLLVSTCRTDRRNPSLTALLDALLGYMSSDRPQPRERLDGNALRSLLKGSA